MTAKKRAIRFHSPNSWYVGYSSAKCEMKSQRLHADRRNICYNLAPRMVPAVGFCFGGWGAADAATAFRRNVAPPCNERLNFRPGQQKSGDCRLYISRRTQLNVAGRYCGLCISTIFNSENWPCSKHSILVFIIWKLCYFKDIALLGYWAIGLTFLFSHPLIHK